MNANRMRFVAEVIALIPEHYDQGEIGSLVVHGIPKGQGDPIDPNKLIGHACGTAGCIAGWVAAIYSPVNHNDPDVSCFQHYLAICGVATDSLDLKEGEACRLFKEDWPQEWTGFLPDPKIPVHIDSRGRFNPTAAQTCAILHRFSDLGFVPKDHPNPDDFKSVSV